MAKQVNPSVFIATLQARMGAAATSGADDTATAEQLRTILEDFAARLVTRGGFAPAAAWATARGLFAIAGANIGAPLPAAFTAAALRDLEG